MRFVKYARFDRSGDNFHWEKRCWTANWSWNQYVTSRGQTNTSTKRSKLLEMICFFLADSNSIVVWNDFENVYCLKGSCRAAQLAITDQWSRSMLPHFPGKSAARARPVVPVPRRIGRALLVIAKGFDAYRIGGSVLCPPSICPLPSFKTDNLISNVDIFFLFHFNFDYVHYLN